MPVTVLKLRDEWTLGPEIGKGGFAKVFEATSKAGAVGVAKLIPKAPGAKRELLFEEELAGVPNVVPIIDQGEHGEFLAIVMPRARMSLRDYLKEGGGKLHLDQVQAILSDVLTALVAIRDKVVHRDIKPENILLLDGHWCLADFGIARYVEATTSSDTRKLCFSRPYAAPERWREERATSASDIYSMGVLAFELLSGNRPFAGPSPEDFRDQHLHQNPPELKTGLPDMDSLVPQCLFKAPEARPTPSDFIARMKNVSSRAISAYPELSDAFSKQVALRMEEQTKASIEATKSELRARLHSVARELLHKLRARLHAAIEVSAPGCSRLIERDKGRGQSWHCTLLAARISIDREQFVSSTHPLPGQQPPLDVIAYTAVVLQFPRLSSGYAGRAHSLWYCDAKEVGQYHWFETAFMYHSFTKNIAEVVPFHLEPSLHAFEALSPGYHKNQVAWPFTALDTDQAQADFVKRWIQWLAQAAKSELNWPQNMPEKDPNGSWRHD